MTLSRANKVSSFTVHALTRVELDEPKDGAPSPTKRSADIVLGAGENKLNKFDAPEVILILTWHTNA